MDISHLELRQLRYFVAVAEELHFSRAAERLHMSQPPLSRQIQILEAELGTALFRRTKRKVEVTEAGQYLLQAARKLLGAAQEALTSTQAAGRGEIGELRIGSNFSSPLNPHFSKLIAEFRRHHPEVRLLFQEALFHQAIAGLQSGALDLSFTWPLSMAPLGDIRFRLLSEEPLLLCVPRQHPLARRTAVAAEDLRNELLLLSSRQTETRLFKELQEQATRAGFSLRTSLETVHFPIIVNLVAAGYGVALLPRFMGRMTHGEVVFKPLGGVKKTVARIPFVAAYNHKKAGVLVKNFLDIA